jgi:ubiquitin-protein ligase
MARARGAPARTGNTEKDACLLRLQRDLDEVQVESALSNYSVIFPDPKDLQHFQVVIKPVSCLWAGGKYTFNVSIPDGWPFKSPDVRIGTKIWHPNIAELPENGVCLSILRKAYTPALTISSLIQGLFYLFNSPNPDDPLNVEAGDQLRTNPAAFRLKVEDFVESYASD